MTASIRPPTHWASIPTEEEGGDKQGCYDGGALPVLQLNRASSDGQCSRKRTAERTEAWGFLTGASRMTRFEHEKSPVLMDSDLLCIKGAGFGNKVIAEERP